MSKDTRAQERRRQKKIAKQKTERESRIAAYKAKQAKGVSTPSAASLLGRLPQLSDDDFTFWLCHGINYLASDSESGSWTPVFDDIYQGVLPNPQAVVHRVLTRYTTNHVEENQQIDGLLRALLAWAVTERPVVNIYKHEAVRRIRGRDPEGDAEAQARKPHNFVVWAMMDEVKARSLAVSATAGP